MRLVVKISGHVISPKPGIIDTDYILELSNTIEYVLKTFEKIVIVTGGGESARSYIRAGSKLGFNEFEKDRIGIELARIHALILSYTLPESSKIIPKSLEELEKIINLERVVIVGGFEPGQSTTTVAVLSAEAIKASLLILATDVDGIYTSDPKKDPAAKKLDEVSVNELEKIIKKNAKAGTYSLIDPLAINILKRSKIPTIVVNAKDPKNIIKAIKGENVGTRITYP